MHNAVLLPLIGVVTVALYFIGTIFITKQQRASKARQLGCKPAPRYPNDGFLGMKGLKELQESAKARQFPDQLVARNKIMSKLTKRDCTTYTFDVYGQRIFFTSDPVNIQAMLAKQFPDYELGPVRRAVLAPTFGSGIFVQDGKEWEHSRTLMRPNFVTEQISDLDLDERHVMALMKAIPVEKDGWTKFTNIQELFFRLTLDASTEFLFGESVHSQTLEAKSASGRVAGERNESTFSENFDSALRHLAQQLRLSTFYWMYKSDELKKNNEVVHNFAQSYVDSALKRIPKDSKMDPEKKYVFLDALVHSTRDPDELRASILNTLLAGRDTTASLLSWVWHQLMRHPDVFNRLRSVVLEEFGTYENPKNLTFSNLKACKYMQQVVNETLRLWTVIPRNGRRTNKDTTLPVGGGPDGKSPVFVPANSDVQMSTHCMHRNKTLWGPDADEFKPERFANRRPGWEYLPFNGGPRICIGQQFALTEVCYATVRLLQRFDKMEPAEGQLKLPVLSDLSFSNTPGRPVTVRLHEASKA